MRWIPVNFELIKNPYNWLVVGLMVAILALSLHLIFGGANALPTTDGTAPSN